MEKENKALAIPEDVVVETMLQMPPKSLLCVPENWESIVSKKSFRDLYLERSITRPRLLFAFFRQTRELELVFLSVYQEEKPLLSSGQQEMYFSPGQKYTISEPIRGLVCLQSDTKVVLCNPGTNKLLHLPPSPVFEEDQRLFFKSFLGYDEATDVFKLLCWNPRFHDGHGLHGPYQVFTVKCMVGSGKESWRQIGNKHIDHMPITNALCKGGVLYYGALCAGDYRSIVMSFKLSSEDFDVIELPEGVHFSVTEFVNYKGKIAFVNESVNDNGGIQIWFRDEIARVWRVEDLVISFWRETVEARMKFKLIGTIRTKELVFARVFEAGNSFEGPHFVLYYDTVTQNLRKFNIEGVLFGPDLRTFVNHVDSLLLFEKETMVGLES